MNQVLEGIRILDFSRYVAGPLGTMTLADMGAEVIRVEKPGGEDDRILGPHGPNKEIVPGIYLCYSRNRKGITLNLRDERSHDLLIRLVKLSDVVVHNFTPDTKEAGILSYDALKEINPGIIVVAVSGFGQTGPYRKRPCFDAVAQGISGVMSLTGFPDNPPTRAGAPVADCATGVYTALGTMFALYHRQKTGQGQMVDVAMFDSAVSLVAGFITEYTASGRMRTPLGNQSYYNLSDTYKAKDGWIFINILTHSPWKRFARMLDMEELVDDLRFRDDMARFENRDFVHPFIENWVKDKTVDECVNILEQAHIPCSPVYNLDQVVADPQVKHRKALLDIDHPGIGRIKTAGMVTKLSETPGNTNEVKGHAPGVGENNKEIYCDLLGISRAQLASYIRQGIV